MPAHIMLSYQWDDQALVKRIYDRLRDDGLPVWMDIEGGVTGNINDAMAAGVEEAVVVCPFMTPAYQASRSCKKELNYADSREVIMVPVMLAKNWEASEWLGLITAGMLWVDFRNAESSEEHFEQCLQSLEEEIMFNAGHLLSVEEVTSEEKEEQEEEEVDQQKHKHHHPVPKKKPGRCFRHALSLLYLCESGEQKLHPESGERNTVELQQEAAESSYWEEVKGSGCKYYRNVVTNGYLGFDPNGEYVYTKASPCGAEEWVLLADDRDQGYERAVVIKNKHSGRFLAVQNGSFIGLPTYTADCKWLLR